MSKAATEEAPVRDTQMEDVIPSAIYYGNSLSSVLPKRWPEPMTEEEAAQERQKYGRFKGWLLPYIIQLDRMFNNGRWLWWLKCLAQGEVTGPIPQIAFHGSSQDSPETREAMKHLEKIIERLELRTGSWSALRNMMEWIVWSCGMGRFPKEISEEQHNLLYKEFNAGLLVRAPYDYLGAIISDRKGGGGWNPHAFYPTPFTVVEMMTRITIDTNTTEKGIFTTMIDPCIGTGRFPLCVSNHTVFVCGVDIDPTMVIASTINAFLYAPWMVWPISPLDEPPYHFVPFQQRIKAIGALNLYQRFMTELAELHGIKPKEAADASVTTFTEPVDTPPVDVPPLPFVGCMEQEETLLAVGKYEQGKLW